MQQDFWKPLVNYFLVLKDKKPKHITWKDSTILTGFHAVLQNVVFWMKKS